jgi:hypothetical protein
MRQRRYLAMFLLVLALGLAIGIGPVTAAIYQDTFTATISSQSDGPLGAFNPYGLSAGNTFNWYIIYDTATVNGAGWLPLSAYSSINQISIAVPRNIPSGSSPQILTKTMDDNYGTDYFDNPYGMMTGGALTGLAYYSSLILSSPYTGYFTLDFNTTGMPALYFDPPSGQSVYSAFFVNLGLGDFDPSTDRQVVPIPGAMVLLGSGLVTMMILRRRQG